MNILKKFAFLMFLLTLVSGVSINLYLTDSKNKNFDAIQYDCFRIITFIEKSQNNQQIMLYCITELLSEEIMVESKFFSKYTFADLSAQNITSQQLYLWSASIDLIEDYQNYLNQLLISNNSSLAMNIFYNCTLPRFGTICQYELDNYHSNYTSIQEIIRDYYQNLDSKITTDISCYIHLKCDRGPSPLCLDWSEICDGRIDCLNDGIDEEYCWQLEINECQENEFHCINGQCIPKSFYNDGTYIPDCLDQSDEYGNVTPLQNDCFEQESSFKYDDIICYDVYLTSSCIQQRVEHLMKALFSVQDNSVSDDCWFAMKNLTYMPSLRHVVCIDDNIDEIMATMIKPTCPDMIFIPSVPVLFNNTFFAYTKADLQMRNLRKRPVPYTCYNDSRYDRLFVNYSRIIFNNSICYRSYENQPTKSNPCFLLNWLKDYVRPAFIALKKQNLFINYNSILCNRSNMYQCINSSKCISIHRLMDTIEDCPYSDDENKTQIRNDYAMKMIIKNRIKIDDHSKLFEKVIEFSLQNNIFAWRRIISTEINYILGHISFQTICDGYQELTPILINGRNHTDETECDLWSCDNIYTSCNGYSNCPHGKDEFNCQSDLSFNCSLDELQCISIHTKEFICLSKRKINDGTIDCVGAQDEPYKCYRNDMENHYFNFYCLQNNSSQCLAQHILCDGIVQCDDEIDEYFCEQNRLLPMYTSICDNENQSKRSKIEHFLCKTFSYHKKDTFMYFILKQPNTLKFKQINTIKTKSNNHIRRSAYCHRGFAVKTVCFCPPSFYGNRCQYQNQRISLTVQFRTSSNSWQIPFAIVISLIENTDQRLIHSYEQLTYLPVRDCQTKFHFYLLYSTRPKDKNKQYAIHIDIYEKTTFNYRASSLIVIQFPFLPVHRLPFIIDIPASKETLILCSMNQCIHGKCIKYSNDLHSSTFCQCASGWSGRFCTIPYTCTCSSDSLCLGVTHKNQSICICPLHKYGPRCFLIDQICSMCQNGGECIPHIELPDTYTCICPTGYKGKHCEVVENKIILSFEKNLIVPESIFIHFILLFDIYRPYQRITNFQTIPYKQESIVIYWSQPFHLIFTEFSKTNYYLTLIRNDDSLLPSTINAMIHHSNRCRHINEIFNKTFVEMHIIRRIKYYHIPCRMFSLNLSCFYDDIHLCLCQTHRQQRIANCFEFNHNITFDCQGQSVCENDAHCFQDSPICPKQSICICRPCFYGTRCQFSTTAFSLSIEAVLGYHIQPHVNLFHQPTIVQISMLISIILILFGFINSICVMITFRQRSLCQVGCGIYLFTISITTLLTTIIFCLKFWFLIQIQRGILTNRLFLIIQCYSIDFLFSCCLKMDQWLTTCVAIERAIITIKNVRFNKRKSRQTAKLVIFILILCIFATNIHDPIYRQIIDEKNEVKQRIWCIVSYSSFLKTYNYTMNTFHFIAPFLLNILSVFILFTKKTTQQTSIEAHRSYNSIFIQHIQEHKHLLIAPIVSIILSLPRIIISFVFKCMKSTNDSWLYLFGYFISLVPYLIIFIVFILPSKFYMSEYRQVIRHYQNRMQRYARIVSIRLTNLANNTVRPV